MGDTMGRIMKEKRPVGRPKGPPTHPATQRLNAAQHAAYLELGGSRFVKRLLDAHIAKQRK